jgi:hypothetical protein
VLIIVTFSTIYFSKIEKINFMIHIYIYIYIIVYVSPHIVNVTPQPPNHKLGLLGVWLNHLIKAIIMRTKEANKKEHTIKI